MIQDKAAELARSANQRRLGVGEGRDAQAFGFEREPQRRQEGEVIAVALLLTRDGENRAFSLVHALVLPALECLQRELEARASVEGLTRDLQSRDEDLELLLKTAPSAFFGTLLTPLLIREGVDTIIVVGESTSGCVRATVVDGKSYRFKVIVPEECVFDRDEAPHAINLFDMDQKYADVIPLEQVLAYLDEIAPARALAGVR